MWQWHQHIDYFSDLSVSLIYFGLYWKFFPHKFSAHFKLIQQADISHDSSSLGHKVNIYNIVSWNFGLGGGDEIYATWLEKLRVNRR